MKKPKLRKLPKQPKSSNPEILENYAKRLAAVKADNQKKMKPWHDRQKRIKSARERIKKIRNGRS